MQSSSVVSSQDHSSFQSFLDHNQYRRKNILRYERVYGHGFVSTGGQITTEEFCKMLDLKPGEKVLDVGCGIGGGDLYLAKTFGVTVHGVDLSSNMISIAEERKLSKSMTDKVSFEICDITKVKFPENHFDVIYSRDTILHIENKPVLFSNFLKWLKPGGRLLVTDYCRGDQRHSEEFVEYVRQRNYHLLTVRDYGKLLKDVGFHEVKAEDLTGRFVDILRLELERLMQDESFIRDFGQSDYDEFVDGWNGKIRRCLSGDQAWGLFMAVKS